MDPDIKEVRVTGDAAAYLEPSMKRTRKAKKITLSAPSEAIAASTPVAAAPVAAAVAAAAPAAAAAAPAAPVAAAPAAPIVKLIPKVTKVKKPSIPLTRKKRVFTAKKINVMIAEADPKTRKARKAIAKKVATMGLDELRKELETKGLLKKGKKEVPEEMLRSMMRDAYTLSEEK
jgi:3-oxoacyl-ACP reductase-like protein